MKRKLGGIVQRFSSIVAIKREGHQMQYLLYTDKNWNLKFFPNFTSVSDDTENIKKKLSVWLKLDVDSIWIQYAAEGSERKYSTEHKEEREYHYRFYTAKLENFPGYQKDEFELEGVHYYWMTIDDMLQDPELKQNNKYVIQMIRDHT